MPPKESLDPPLLRQWKLLRALSASRQDRTIRELQGDAQVSEKTVRRDLLTLAGAGFPLHERLADYGKKLWRIEARAGVPDFNITFDEALGLYLANRLLEPLAGSGFWESAQAAIQKIRVMLGDTAIRYVEKMADAVHVTRRAMAMPNKAEIVDTLLQGLEERKVVWLTYQSQRATEPVTYDGHSNRHARCGGTEHQASSTQCDRLPHRQLTTSSVALLPVDTSAIRKLLPERCALGPSLSTC